MGSSEVQAWSQKFSDLPTCSMALPRCRRPLSFLISSCKSRGRSAPRRRQREALCRASRNDVCSCVFPLQVPSARRGKLPLKWCPAENQIFANVRNHLKSAIPCFLKHNGPNKMRFLLILALAGFVLASPTFSNTVLSEGVTIDSENKPCWLEYHKYKIGRAHV